MLQTLTIDDFEFLLSRLFSQKVLHNIKLNLPQKGLVLVKGISGSGKSTLLKILAGSLKVDEGRISFNGHENRAVAAMVKT